MFSVGEVLQLQHPEWQRRARQGAQDPVAGLQAGGDWDEGAAVETDGDGEWEVLQVGAEQLQTRDVHEGRVEFAEVAESQRTVGWVLFLVSGRGHWRDWKDVGEFFAL